MFSSNFVLFYHKLVSLKSSELLISTILATLFRRIMHSAMMYLKKMSTTQQRVLLYSPIPYPESLQYASLILPNTKWLGLMSCIHLVTQEVEQTLARWVEVNSLEFLLWVWYDLTAYTSGKCQPHALHFIFENHSVYVRNLHRNARHLLHHI